MEKNGFSLLKLNDYSAAIKVFEQNVLEMPTLIKNWHGLGLAYALNNQYLDFLKVIDKAECYCNPYTTFLINLFLDLISRPSGYYHAENRNPV